MMPQLIRLIQTYGLMPHDSYNTDTNFNAATRKVHAAVRSDAMTMQGLKKARAEAGRILDNNIGPLPYHVYMYSMEYTPLEFAHSVCMPDEYQAFTSFTHLPMNKESVLCMPDNYNGYRFMNIGIDQMMGMIEKSVRHGHPVCWEGDTSEEGFSFEKGRKFFICKNSWGTANPYGGFMYVSADYIRLKTIAIMANVYAISPQA